MKMVAKFWRGGRLAAVFLLLLAAACRSAGEEVVVGEGTPQPTPAAGGVIALVTRLVEQITFVTSTPDPLATSESADPVVLDISLSGRLPNIDPGLAESQTQLDLAQNLFVGLTNFNPDTNTIEPELASTWSVAADGRTWTFNLRDDVYWVRPRSLGPSSEALVTVNRVRPVTADDVAFAVQRVCGRQASNSTAFSLFIIEGCEALYTKLEVADEDLATVGIRALDETTLEVRLREPASYFLTLSSMPFFQPVPRDMVTDLGNEWLDAIGEFSSGWQVPANLLTSGPYVPVLSRLTRDYVVLHPNTHWPLDRPGNADVVNLTFLSEDMDAFEMWQGRLLDIAPLPTTEREQMQQRTPAKVRTIPGQVLFYIGFDFGSLVLQEAAVRRALSAAIDRQALVDELYDGLGMPMRHATLPGTVAGLPAQEIGVGYSPDYARQQMAASTARSCRLLPEITVLVSSADLSLLQAELIRDMWVEELECIAENIHIEQVQFGGLLAATMQDSEERPDIWELAWAPTFPDAHNMINDLLHCEDSENRQNRQCSEADTLLSRAGTVVDAAERMALYRQVESLFFNENGSFPIAPLYIRTREIVVQDWIEFNPIAFGGAQWDRVTVDALLKELEKSR